jgi:hypothetical protein
VSMLTGCSRRRRELVSFCGLAFDIHGWLYGIGWSLESGVLPLLLVVLSSFGYSQGFGLADPATVHMLRCFIIQFSIIIVYLINPFYSCIVSSRNFQIFAERLWNNVTLLARVVECLPLLWRFYAGPA